MMIIFKIVHLRIHIIHGRRVVVVVVVVMIMTIMNVINNNDIM